MSHSIIIDDLAEVVRSLAKEYSVRFETLLTAWDDTGEDTLWAVYYHDPDNNPQGGDVLCEDLEKWLGCPRRCLGQIRGVIERALRKEIRRNQARIYIYENADLVHFFALVENGEFRKKACAWFSMSDATRFNTRALERELERLGGTP